MKRRINLYQPPPPEPFSFLNLVPALLLVVLLSVLMVVGSLGFQHWGELRLTKLAAMKSELTTLDNRLAEHQKMLAALAPDPALIQQQAVVQQRINAETQLIRLIGLLERDRRAPFSDYLAGVSNADQPKVWLDGMSVDLPDQKLSLTGLTQASEQVPLMLTELMQRAPFAGMQVETFEIKPEPEGSLRRYLVEATLSGERGYKFAK